MVDAVNPFGNRQPVSSPGQFYGRERELQALADKLRRGQSVSLVGSRRIGKSSLLQYFADQCAIRSDWGLSQAVCVLVDGQLLLRLPNADQLLDELLKRAASTLKVPPPPPGAGPYDLEEW